MANMVMLGSFLEVTNLLKLDSIIEAFTKVFGDKKKHLIPANQKALDEGMNLIKNNETGNEDQKDQYRKTPKSFALATNKEFEAKFKYDESIFDDPITTARYALEFEQNASDYYRSLNEN